MAHGPAAGLAIVDALATSRRCADYQWLPSVRGDLLAKAGAPTTKRGPEFMRAAALARQCAREGAADGARAAAMAP
jgi:predicted RNA polymerase sigma factor